MVEKDLELELDIQYVKNLISSCTCVFDKTKIKFATFDKKYNIRKNFVFVQFKSIFLKHTVYCFLNRYCTER